MDELCKIGTRKKIFLKLKSNKKHAGFGLYLNYIMEPKKNIYNLSLKSLFKNNEDVDWFHVKGIQQK